MENTLKAISESEEEIRVANYLVLWGSPDQRDLTFLVGLKNADGSGGEYFTPETVFDSPFTKAGRLTVDWEHGRDKEGPADQALGFVDWSTAKADDVGLWAERVLYRRSKYMKVLEQLIRAGLVGNSTQAAPDLVEKADDGRIVRWGLYRDSLTVVPMEPRMMTENQLQAVKAVAEDLPEIKSMFSDLEPEAQEPPQVEKSTGATADGVGSVTVESNPIVPKEETGETMELNEQVKALQDQVTALSGNVQQLLQLMQDDPAVRKSGLFSDDGGNADQHVKSFADFLLSIQRGDHTRLVKVYGTQKALNEATGENGGYLVPTEYNTQLLKVGFQASPILSLVQQVPISSDAGEWPALDIYAAPTAGSGNTALAAGVKASKRAETAASTETEPKFEMIKWRLGDIGGFTKVSMNLVSDSPQAIEALLTTLFGIAVASKKEYFILRGNGVSEPLGILNSPAAIGVDPATNATWAYVDAVKMTARFKQITGNVRWVQHQSLVPDYAASGWVLGNTVYNIASLGYGPAINSEHLPQADNSGCSLLADFGAYLWFEKGSTEIAFSEHVAFTERLGTWRFNARCDGQPWMKGPITQADPQGSYTVSPFVYFND